MDSSVRIADEPALVVYLDINKTVLQVDPAAKASVSDVGAGLIAENAWGLADLGSGSWELCSDTLSIDQPEGVASSENKKLMVYDSFLKNIKYPYVKDAERGSEEAELRLKENVAKKAATRAAIRRFHESGNLGEAFQEHHTLIIKALSPPEARTPSSTSAPPSSDHVFLIPAYFRLMKYLVQSGRRFVVVFRTFGWDLRDVIAEHNSWCDGRHPYFPSPEGEDLSWLRIQLPQATGSFVRFADTSAGIQLAAVKDALPDGTGGHVAHITGFRDIHDFLTASLRDAVSASRTSRGKVLALTDYYPWWWENHERAHAGKLMPFDPSDVSQHHIFLDDNIGRRCDAVRLMHADHVSALRGRGAGKDAGAGADGLPPLRIATTSKAVTQSVWEPAPGEPEVDARIVDARDIRTGAAIPFHRLRNVHVVRVDPLSAILNPNYFIELIALCERNRTAVLERQRHDEGAVSLT